jgi:phosphoribosyl-AMP cyclohydrolase / phosphoribosyl-ATP pyrophosphohydrolase
MNLKFEKYADGLVPAVVQDADTGRVLMLGFMNEEAVETTLTTGRVTFFSRSKGRLWTKGETSGNGLELVSIAPDCDADTLLIKANPQGPTCHTGADTCFGEANELMGFLSELESIIAARRIEQPYGSYVAKLFGKGLNKIAQKVGEEAVETVIASKDDDSEAFRNEAADLLFHLLVLLGAKETSLNDVVEVLRSRHRPGSDLSE